VNKNKAVKQVMTNPKIKALIQQELPRLLTEDPSIRECQWK